MQDGSAAPEMERVPVLVVDALEENLANVAAFLGDSTYDLVMVQSGREALRHLLSRDFGVVLLDVRMPDLDGFETATMIRRHPRRKNTPLIFVTACYPDDVEMLRG